jgi:hypothetical protein
MDSNYPINVAIDYPDRPLNRASTGLRLLVAIPILLVLGMMNGSFGADFAESTRDAFQPGGVLLLPVGLMILFRAKYPRWWFDWNYELSHFFTRVGIYLALMDDRYPSTDERRPLHCEVPFPDVEADLTRWKPFVKWLLAIPHYVVMFFLGIAAVAAVIAAWFAILVTGRYPRALFDFVEGVIRWYTRVTWYAVLMATDEYPPFRLAA